MSGQKKKLQREIEKNSFDRSKFFGLGNFGIKLFKVYVYLNSGDWIENLTSLEYHQGKWEIFQYNHHDFDQIVENESFESKDLEHLSAQTPKELYNNMLKDMIIRQL